MNTPELPKDYHYFCHARAKRGFSLERRDLLARVRAELNDLVHAIIAIQASGQHVTQDQLDRRKAHEDQIESFLKQLDTMCWPAKFGPKVRHQVRPSRSRQT
jgi:hypothetical protein